MTADSPATCDIAGGHLLRLRAIALALRGPPLQYSDGSIANQKEQRKQGQEPVQLPISTGDDA